MSTLPTGWSATDTVSDEQIYGSPPNAGDETKVQFYGFLDGDVGYRVYSIPRSTKLATVVEFFQVGSHGAVNNGEDVEATVNLVAEKAEAIAALVPCQVTFADAAGLKLRFTRKITAEEVRQIEELFPEDIQFQAGLERYIAEWDGQSPLLEPLLRENMIHLWWD